MSSVSGAGQAVRLVLAIVLAAALYWVAVGKISTSPRPKADTGTLVKLPIFVEVALAGGDRYLAANIGTVRGMVAMVEPNANSDAAQKVVAAIQKDVSWLNPGHEDNYYVSSANLIGTPYHRDGQWILRRAIDGRPFDFMPPFFYAVNRMFYDHDPADGARWMRMAAERSSNDEDNRASMEQIAARWIVKGEDPQMAIATLEMMAEQARTRALRENFLKRAQQARNLLALQQSVARYSERFGRLPDSVEELKASNVLEQIPTDPFGNRYVVGKDGKPEVRPTPRIIRK